MLTDAWRDIRAWFDAVGNATNNLGAITHSPATTLASRSCTRVPPSRAARTRDERKDAGRAAG